MLTRKGLAVLAVVTLVLFGLAALLGNHNHGLRQAAADVSWTGFLVCLLFLIVGSAVVLVRSRGRLRGQS
jgi:choline-glycine betaine transporter